MRNGSDHEGDAARGKGSGVDALDSTTSEFIFSTDWRSGPRTRAWDELWRRLLAGLAGVPAASDPEIPEADTPAVRTPEQGRRQ